MRMVGLLFGQLGFGCSAGEWLCGQPAAGIAWFEGASAPRVCVPLAPCIARLIVTEQDEHISGIADAHAMAMVVDIIGRQQRDARGWLDRLVACYRDALAVGP